MQLFASVRGREGSESPDCNDGRRKAGACKACGIADEDDTQPAIKEDGGQGRHRRIKGRDVVRQTRLHRRKEEEHDEREDGKDAQGAQILAAEDLHDRGRIEQDPGRCGDEENEQVVPGVRVVAFDLHGGAREYVEAEVLVCEGRAIAMQHREVPGQNGQEEEAESGEEGEAEVGASPALDERDGEEGENENDAGCAFGHERDGEAEPEEKPAAAIKLLHAHESENSDEFAEREQRVHLPGAADVEKAEGAEQDDAADPGSAEAVAAREPAMQKRDGGDAGERGAGTCPELRDAEETKEARGDPEHQRRFFEPGLEVPERHQQAVVEHLACGFGVDAFVPHGERAMAEQRQKHGAGEDRRESGGQAGARGGVACRWARVHWFERTRGGGAEPTTT